MNQLHNRCLAILLAVAIALAAPLSGAIQYSTAVRNAQLDALETTIGTSPVLKIFDGTKPANCAAADAGTVLVTMTLPSDWMDAASSGSKSKLGTWSGTVSDAGTAQYFRIYATGGSTCHIQGSVTGSGGGGEITLQNTNLAPGQSVSITSFSITAGNA